MSWEILHDLKRKRERDIKEVKKKETSEREEQEEMKIFKKKKNALEKPGDKEGK